MNGFSIYSEEITVPGRRPCTKIQQNRYQKQERIFIWEQMSFDTFDTIIPMRPADDLQRKSITGVILSKERCHKVFDNILRYVKIYLLEAVTEKMRSSSIWLRNKLSKTLTWWGLFVSRTMNNAFKTQRTFLFLWQKEICMDNLYSLQINHLRANCLPRAEQETPYKIPSIY